MKRILAVLMICFVSLTAFAQKKDWKEMKSFHEVMSATFHPSEENNLQPLKEKSGELVKRAKAWKTSAVPEGYSATVTAPLLKRLVKEAEALNKMVKKGDTDAALKQKIATLHDTFHEITEKCREH